MKLVKKNTKEMRFKELQTDMIKKYTTLRNIIKKYQSLDKKDFKKLRKLVNNEIEQLNTDFLYKISEEDNCIFSSLFIMTLDSLNEVMVVSTNTINFNDIKKDKEFVIYLKNILLVRHIFNQMVDYPKYEQNLITHNYYFGSLTNSIISYFLIFEKNITETKILNLYSFFLKNTFLLYSEDMISTIDKKKIQQITTGVKYEKVVKNKTNNITYTQPKNKKFNLLQHLSTRIKIKYVREKKHCHNSHKSPVEHIRKGHYRHYKNGNVVWIEDSVINEGLVS